jgi:hypothetical protein
MIPAPKEFSLLEDTAYGRVETSKVFGSLLGVSAGME